MNGHLRTLFVQKERRMIAVPNKQNVKARMIFRTSHHLHIYSQDKLVFIFAY